MIWHIHVGHFGIQVASFYLHYFIISLKILAYIPNVTYLYFIVINVHLIVNVDQR